MSGFVERWGSSCFGGLWSVPGVGVRAYSGLPGDGGPLIWGWGISVPPALWRRGAPVVVLPVLFWVADVIAQRADFLYPVFRVGVWGALTATADSPSAGVLVLGCPGASPHFTFHHPPQ